MEINQRPIKFRAWHKHLRKMVHFGAPKMNVEYRFLAFQCTEFLDDKINDLPGAYGMVSEDSPVGSYRGNTENIDEWVLMQYTGLNDVNGKEIYEGDLIRLVNDSTRYVYEVKWAVEERGESYEDGFRTGFHCMFTSNKYEVVGNIYENKELLEEKK